VYLLITAPSLPNGMGVVAATALLMIMFWARLFALRVQDRVIRLEMHLRVASLAPDLGPRFGEFTMGSPASEQGRNDSEEPQHRVVFAKPLAVAKFDVTFDDWDACVAYGDCTRVTDAGYGRGRQPVINVTWDQARQYAAWLSRMTGKPYRLLSEAEFEYAARAGTLTAYPWGDEIGKNNANCAGCGSKWDNRQPAPVGSFALNRFGLYDMHGNVWEWCSDAYALYGAPEPQGTPETGGAARVNRVNRGGSFYHSATHARSAYRNNAAPDMRINHLGVRPARPLRP